MLFIPMIAAAARAAFSASGDSLAANSEKIALVVVRSREARAQAMKVPARCCSVSRASLARLDRLSFRSLAYSGRAFFRASIDMGFSWKKPPSFGDGGKGGRRLWG